MKDLLDASELLVCEVDVPPTLPAAVDRCPSGGVPLTRFIVEFMCFTCFVFSPRKGIGCDVRIQQAGCPQRIVSHNWVRAL